MAVVAASISEAADLVRALAWPAAAVGIVAIARPELAQLLRELPRRVSKISAFGVQLELAKAEPLSGGEVVQAATQEALSPEDVSARAQAVVASDVKGTLRDLITAGKRAEYGIIDLGEGQSWLSSRLFIFAAMLRWTLGLERFVFTDSAAAVQGFVGTAATDDICVALGDAYPWLPIAFATAVGQTGAPVVPGEPQAQQAILIIRNYVTAVQSLTPDPPQPAAEWVQRTPQGIVRWEHARWLDGAALRHLLKDRLDTQRVVVSAPDAVKQVVAADGPYVAAVDPDGRFRWLVDRTRVTAKVARKSLDITAPHTTN